MEVSEWSVGLVYRSHVTAIDERGIDALITGLADHFVGAASFAPQGKGVSLNMWVESASAWEALKSGDGAVRRELAKIAVLDVDLVESLVVEWERAQVKLAEPNQPDLVGLAEIAELLAVSKQRASALAGAGSFPEPVARLKSGPVWERASILGFVETWYRRPGRRAEVS